MTWCQGRFSRTVFQVLAPSGIGMFMFGRAPRPRPGDRTAVARGRTNSDQTNVLARVANVIAISVVALIPSVAVFFAAQRHFIEGATSSGVKG